MLFDYLYWSKLLKIDENDKNAEVNIFQGIIDTIAIVFVGCNDNPYLVGNYPRHVAVKLKFSMFQIEISIMKSVSEDQMECFLIYDHDDLTHLDIEINFFEKIIFGAQD